MRNSSQLNPADQELAARMPAFGLPVVVELPPVLEPVAVDTFGGLTGAPSTHQ
jgi:hypothetical protein